MMAGTWTCVRLRGLLLLVGLRGLEVRRLRHDRPAGTGRLCEPGRRDCASGDCGQPGGAVPGRGPGFRWWHPGVVAKRRRAHGNRRARSRFRYGAGLGRPTWVAGPHENAGSVSATGWPPREAASRRSLCRVSPDPGGRSRRPGSDGHLASAPVTIGGELGSGARLWRM